MERLYRKYQDRVAFLMVYIREAHPEDGWQLPSNARDKVVFNRPKSLGERQSIAKKCCTKLNLSMPCVVDTIDNRVDEAYAGWPERLFVVLPDGKVAYAGAQGPWGFKVRDVEEWLDKNVGKERS